MFPLESILNRIITGNASGSPFQVHHGDHLIDKINRMECVGLLSAELF